MRAASDSGTADDLLAAILATTGGRVPAHGPVMIPDGIHADCRRAIAGTIPAQKFTTGLSLCAETWYVPFNGGANPLMVCVTVTVTSINSGGVFVLS